jgi:hypothetical protein
MFTKAEIERYFETSELDSRIDSDFPVQRWLEGAPNLLRFLHAIGRGFCLLPSLELLPEAGDGAGLLRGAFTLNEQTFSLGWGWVARGIICDRGVH